MMTFQPSWRSSERTVPWLAMTATTAFVARWLRVAIEDRPRVKEHGAPAACDPAAARAEQKLADTPIWRRVERVVARRALQPFRIRPSLQPLRVLDVDHGPGGVAVALGREAPQDATIVALDSLAGMSDLAQHRAARRGTRARLDFVRGWSYGLPFGEGAFDLVVSAGGMHQWPNPEAALAEIGRVLKPGGRFFVLDLRRDLSLPLWLLTQVLQALVVAKDLRALGEPGTSIRSAYTYNETEWLAGRAKLPDFHITMGPAWLMLERGHEALSDERSPWLTGSTVAP